MCAKSLLTLAVMFRLELMFKVGGYTYHLNTSAETQAYLTEDRGDRPSQYHNLRVSEALQAMENLPESVISFRDNRPSGQACVAWKAGTHLEEMEEFLLNHMRELPWPLRPSTQEIEERLHRGITPQCESNSGLLVLPPSSNSPTPLSADAPTG